MNFIKREGLLAIDYENGVTARENDFDVPDEEVRRDLMLLVAAQAAEAEETWVGDTVRHLRRLEFDDFFAGLKSLFAHLPYGSKEDRVYEMSYERALKILFWAQGLRVETEDTQSVGPADIVVKYRKAIYVFELKRDGAATSNGRRNTRGAQSPRSRTTGTSARRSFRR